MGFTYEWFITGMSSHVNVQMGLLGKVLATVGKSTFIFASRLLLRRTTSLLMRGVAGLLYLLGLFL